MKSYTLKRYGPGLKKVLSLTVIATFILFGFACSLEDFEVGGDVPCATYTIPLNATSQIHIEVKDNYGDAISEVNLDVKVEKFRVIKEADQCKLVLKEKYTKKLTTNDLFGLAFFNDYNEFYSHGDKNIITVKANKAGYTGNSIRFVKKDNLNDEIKLELINESIFP